MPAGIGRKYANDMFAAIGGLTRRGRAENSLGMGGAQAAQRRANLIKYGKNTTGYGMIGASAISMMSTDRSTGAYKPRPINPISSAQGSGRYA